MRALHKLSAVRVGSLKEAGYYSDGGGLYLRVAIAGGGGAPRVLKSWVFRYERNARTREAGLGSVSAVSLAAARSEAQHMRELLADKIDPIERRRAEADATRAVARSMTFKECAEAYLEAHEPTWKNAKHRQQWRNTLNTYAYPKIGAMPAKDVGVTDVLKVLQPIWHSKPETGSRLRGRIETVLSYAKALGQREGENAAVWKDNLAQLLPATGRVRRVKHHSSLPYADVPKFVVDLRKDTGIAASALELCILCASRTAEVRGATFDEFDLDDRVWTIPAIRMKVSRRDHRVPLSPRAIEIVREMQALKQNDYVFPGLKPGMPLSDGAMSRVLLRAGYGEFTVHGFRSSFRDWSAECTSLPREIAEFSLAHTIPDETERAYLRTTLFDKRRELILEWERFVLGAAGHKPRGIK